MSTRLNKDLREHIARSVCAKKFTKERHCEFEDAIAAVGDEIYDHVIPKECQIMMESLPETYFSHQRNIRVRVGDMHSTNASMSRPRPLPADMVYGSAQIPVRLMKKLEKARDAHSKYKAEEAKARNHAMRVLNSTTSITKLVKIWPEVKPFVPEHAITPAALPALRVEQLNMELGLTADAK